MELFPVEENSLESSFLLQRFQIYALKLLIAPFDSLILIWVFIESKDPDIESLLLPSSGFERKIDVELLYWTGIKTGIANFEIARAAAQTK